MDSFIIVLELLVIIGLGALGVWALLGPERKRDKESRIRKELADKYQILLDSDRERKYIEWCNLAELAPKCALEIDTGTNVFLSAPYSAKAYYGGLDSAERQAKWDMHNSDMFTDPATDKHYPKTSIKSIRIVNLLNDSRQGD